MSKALFPLAVATATFTAMSVLYRRKMDRIQAYFGIKPSTSDVDKLIMGIPHMGLRSGSKTTNLDLSEFSEWEMLNANPNDENKSAATTTTAEKPASRDYPARLPAIISMLQNVPFPDFTRGSDMHYALVAFRKHLQIAMLHKTALPKRGVFYFSGPVSLRGTMGECRVDVRGEYDPSKKKFTSLWMKIRDISLYNQDALATPPPPSPFDQDG